MSIFLFYTTTYYAHYEVEKPSILIAIHAVLIKYIWGFYCGVILLSFKYNIGGLLKKIQTITIQGLTKRFISIFRCISTHYTSSLIYSFGPIDLLCLSYSSINYKNCNRTITFSTIFRIFIHLCYNNSHNNYFISSCIISGIIY